MCAGQQGYPVTAKCAVSSAPDAAENEKKDAHRASFFFSPYRLRN